MYVPEFEPEKSGAVSGGIDVIGIQRINRVLDEFGQRFLDRVFTKAEQARYSHFPNELAGRFAVKEATSKVLGTGIRGIKWKEMETLSNRRGKPVLVLHGSAAERAEMLELDDFSVSITHSRTDAMAIVVGMKRANGPAAE